MTTALIRVSALARALPIFRALPASIHLYSTGGGKPTKSDSKAPPAALPTDLGERLDVCADCEHCKLGPNKLPLWCGECKCAIVPKASFEALHCPIGKW